VVLATAIAETSITLEGVRIVVDSGLARVPRYEPDVGVTRLETVRVSRAAADQRRGRAGRTQPGLCYRLWDEPQTAALEPFARPEILAADLSSFALELAAWGAAPEQLAFLDTPPRPAMTEAKSLLAELGAIDRDGHITEKGKRLRELPLPPRLARMVLEAGSEHAALTAAQTAMVITERGLGGNDIDLRHRLDSFAHDRSQRATSARQTARNWASSAVSAAEQSEQSGMPHLSRTEKPDEEPGALLALAYPERIAKNRGGSSGAFLLANGRGANVDPASPLARESFLSVAELSGTAASGRILLAAPITLAEIEALFADRIEAREEVTFDEASLSLRGRRSRRLGALVLSERPFAISPNEETAQSLAAGIARVGLDRLPWIRALRQWRDRVMFLRASEGDEWPDLSDAALSKTVGEWLAPALTIKTAIGELTADELGVALSGLLSWPLKRRLEAEAPTHFEAPTGSRVPIDYQAEGGPKIAIRVQELFGLDRHPAIAGGKVPLLIDLTSPAHRPVQTTRDLPGFWRGSYAAVRAEMRGRYPKHPWPDDPIAATATRRAKPRKS
jgi:ATP-dependent helicase HrpB